MVNNQNNSQAVRRVIVKWNDELMLPYEDGAEKYLEGEVKELWDTLASQFLGITLKRLYTTASPEQIQALVARALELNPDYRPPNFLSYFVIEGNPNIDLNELSYELQGEAWQSFVAIAYYDPTGVEPSITGSANPEFGNQSYLTAAPIGVDAQFAWQQHSDGAGLKIVVLERAWNTNHDDLPLPKINLLFGSNSGPNPSHGTAVLGILVAQDNTTGCVGICPEVMVGLISHAQNSRHDVMMAALTQMQLGDILLLEVQLSPANTEDPDYDLNYDGALSNINNVPMEMMEADFALIELATNGGVTVIEAAGNGAQTGAGDLDQLKNDLLGNSQVASLFQHLNNDSKAIMVAASTGPTRAPHPQSNFGSRINCYASGEQIRTLAPNNGITNSTNDFGLTSGASAIVAGVAALVQTFAKTTLHRPLGPSELRVLLSNSTINTLSNNATSDRIGVMPNLANLLLALPVV